MFWSSYLQKGFDAAQSGNFATALREWISLAKQKDVDAQFNLSFMYNKGQGVLQDYKTALNLYRIAAEQGDAVPSLICILCAITDAVSHWKMIF